jgi:hypothetical protein
MSGLRVRGSLCQDYGSADPDPKEIFTDPPQCLEGSGVPDPDPHVFGPTGSGSTGQRYGCGSRFFYHQAKIVRKTLNPTVW